MLSFLIQLKGSCNVKDDHKWCSDDDFEGDSDGRLPTSFKIEENYENTVRLCCNPADTETG